MFGEVISVVSGKERSLLSHWTEFDIVHPTFSKFFPKNFFPIFFFILSSNNAANLVLD